MRHLLLLALPLLSLVGCSALGPSASDVLFETTAAVYAPGEEVTVRLVNDTGRDLGYNLCQTIVETQRGGAWEPVGVSGRAPTACPDILLVLGSGQEAERAVALPGDLPAGRYRAATNVEFFDDRRQVKVTAPFEVQ